jgi:peptidoglycan/xylan/chitin deacetylase (PgdA/CDA1 family)
MYGRGYSLSQDWTRLMLKAPGRRRFVAVGISIAAWLLGSTAGAHAAPTVVSLSFDDGYANEAIGASLMESHGMRGTFYVNSGSVGSSGEFSWAQLQALQAGGHEIGGHTVHHTDLTAVNSATAQQEVCDDRTAITSHGLTAKSFAYPYGSYNATAESIVQGCGYTSGRAVGGLVSENGSCSGCPYAETIPPRDPFGLRTPDSVRSTTPLSAIEGYVTQAQAHGGGWVPLVFHQVCDGCSSYSVSQSTLAAFLDWLQIQTQSSTADTSVKTVGQVIGGGSPPPPPPPPPSPDTTPPTVALTSPADGATVAGKVTVAASASDDMSGIREVRFYSDGGLIGSDSSAPYAVDWNSSKAKRGRHVLYAVAFDGAGNSAQSSSVTVTR